tara:strand:- start:158 stop:745 length:588 start_codon:yes stop_codon:yes gene_type:complete
LAQAITALGIDTALDRRALTDPLLTTVIGGAPVTVDARGVIEAVDAALCHITRLACAGVVIVAVLRDAAALSSEADVIEGAVAAIVARVCRVRGRAPSLWIAPIDDAGVIGEADDILTRHTDAGAARPLLGAGVIVITRHAIGAQGLGTAPIIAVGDLARGGLDESVTLEVELTLRRGCRAVLIAEAKLLVSVTC